MKTKILLAASLFLAIGMTGCSNSLDDENAAQPKGETVLVVKLPASVKTTRAVENPTNSSTPTEIVDATIFLLTGEAVWKAEEFSKSEMQTYKRFEQVPTSVDRVIVVANTQQPEHQNSLLDLKTANEVLNYAYNVASQHHGEMLSNRTLMGDAKPAEVEDPAASEHEGHDYREATVTLSAITARMEVGGVVAGEGIETIELVSLWVNNYFNTYKGETQLWPEGHDYWAVKAAGDLLPGIGSVGPIGDITIPPYNEPNYQQDYNSDVKVPTDKKVYAFHVFPGNVPNLVMLVKVKLETNYYEIDENTGDHLKYKYGFVTFTKYNTGQPEPYNYVKAFEGHNVYKMGVGDKGIIIDAKDITDQPNKGKYDLGINVEIADWTFHDVTPEV